MAVPPQRGCFLEVFAGSAGLSRAMQMAGAPVLPPIELIPNEAVPFAVDITDVKVQRHVEKLLREGYISYIHFGTPCCSFSQARKLDGGPPPLRSQAHLWGLPMLSPADSERVQVGNLLLLITTELAGVAHASKVWWSLENPASSWLWAMPPTQKVQQMSGAQQFIFDMCCYESVHMKPTAVMSTAPLASLVRRCDQTRRPHVHEPLVGQVEIQGQQFFKTKLAQVYPLALCRHWAAQVVDPLCLTFNMVTPPGERKRPLGQLIALRAHRQGDTGRKAMSAGYQLKKSVVPPLFNVELEPGEAVRQSLSFTHPFSLAPELDPDLQEALALVTSHPQQVQQHRAAACQYWESRAVQLLSASDQELRALQDPWLRRLLRGVPDDQSVQLGSFFHVQLWRELAQAAQTIDTSLIDAMLHGMRIVGPIATARRWASFDKAQFCLPHDQLRSRAWEFGSKVLKNVKAAEVTQNSSKVWEATMEDVHEGSTIGPFYTKEEVSKIVGEPWIPTQRFEVVQKNKVRGVDSATVNGVNMAAEITEKLDLPSTDVNVAVLRWLKSHSKVSELWGWVLDERKAYRQIPISPDHRRWSVISMKDPSSGQIAYFVMVGHSFGLVAAVYNYNRRSALITDILRRVFHVAAFNFYDDKYGFEPADTVRSAFEVAQAVHFWLGARFDQKKLQIARAPTILGVTYDLVSFCLLIKEDRRIELIDEIEAILSSKMLSPGQAGKLRGKLMFGASQLWGKIGRAFLRSLSERQYSKVPSTAVNRAIELSLEEWKELIVRGPPRKIELIGPRLPDVVVFTDGSYPDQSGKWPDHPWIGGVLFKRGCRPLQFGARVPLDLIQKWLPRKSQIAMVEMFAVVVALETFKEQLRGAWSLLFVDSEPVLGALVKGYSAREDMCELTGFFWKQALNLMCYLYLDRISTDANPADPPSRDKMSVGEKLGWQTIAASFPSL